MDKFYTNITRKGSNILLVGYEDGMRVNHKIAYKPHLFVESQDGDYTLFDSKKKLKKRTFDSVTAMKDFLEQYNGVDNFNIYGCSDLVRQFTAEYYTGEIQWDYSKTEIFFFDIETEVGSYVLKDGVKPTKQVKIRKDDSDSIIDAQDLVKQSDAVEVFDEESGQWIALAICPLITKMGFPEPERADERITMLTFIQNTTGRSFMWALHSINEDNPIFDDKMTEYRSFNNDERAMLKDFMMWFASTPIDIISGWNSELFDVPYIVNRIKKLFGDGAVKLLSPHREVKERLIRFDDSKTKQTYDIAGITHLDYIDLYKKFNPGSQESFKLDHIAFIELGERKVEMPCDTFKEFYTNFWPTFTSYNKQDTMLLYKLEKKLLQVRLAMQLAYMAKCPIADVMSAMRLWESIIYNHFNDKKIVETLGKKHNERHSIVGAYVHEPVPGRYGWTVSCDATSLYPSIMIQNNVSPEKYVSMTEYNLESLLKNHDEIDIPDGVYLSANGLLTQKGELGFIPYLVKQMFDLRKRTKNLMLEKKKQEQELIAKIKSLGGTID